MNHDIRTPFLNNQYFMERYLVIFFDRGSPVTSKIHYMYLGNQIVWWLSPFKSQKKKHKKTKFLGPVYNTLYRIHKSLVEQQKYMLMDLLSIFFEKNHLLGKKHGFSLQFFVLKHLLGQTFLGLRCEKKQRPSCWHNMRPYDRCKWSDMGPL